MRGSKFRTLLLAALIFVLTACGYKPVSHYTHSLFAEPLYLEVVLSHKDPDGGVFLKDAMREALQYRLGSHVTDDIHAAHRLKVTYEVVSFDALGYDAHGYVERYRVNLLTTFVLDTPTKKIRRTVRTTQEADVTPSALTSSKAKRAAIQASAVKAVDQFVAFVAAQSTKQ